MKVMNIWSKPKREKAIVAINVNEERQLWISAFASAVIALKDWTPGDTRGDDFRWRKRLEAERLADFAVAEYRVLKEDSFVPQAVQTVPPEEGASRAPDSSDSDFRVPPLDLRTRALSIRDDLLRAQRGTSLAELDRTGTGNLYGLVEALAGILAELCQTIATAPNNED